MSLQSTEVDNCSQISKAMLLSSFGSSACSQTTFPSIIRPILYLWMMISKMKLYLAEFNCSIIFSLKRLIVSKKINDFLREIVRGKILLWWLNVNPSSFMYGCCRPNKFPRLRSCFCLRSGCNHSWACWYIFLFLWICKIFCVVFDIIVHIFDCSIRNSDPRILNYLDSRTQFEFQFRIWSAENWSWLPILVQFSYFLGSTLLVEKLGRLVEGCIRDKLLYAEIHQYPWSRSIVQLLQHS